MAREGEGPIIRMTARGRPHLHVTGGAEKKTSPRPYDLTTTRIRKKSRTCQLVSRETPVTMRRMPGGGRERGALQDRQSFWILYKRRGLKSYPYAPAPLSSWYSRRGRLSLANSTTMLLVMFSIRKKVCAKQAYLAPKKGFPLKVLTASSASLTKY